MSVTVNCRELIHFRAPVSLAPRIPGLFHSRIPGNENVQIPGKTGTAVAMNTASN